MSEQEATERWGAIVFQTDSEIVRAKEEDGDVVVVINEKEADGRERFPGGRVIGITTASRKYI